MKPLTHAKDENDKMITWDKPLNKGATIIYQTPVERGDGNSLPTISIDVRKIESIVEGETVKFENDPNIYPAYRIRYVISDNKTYFYEGHDYERIEVDEGQMSQETYDKLKGRFKNWMKGKK